jgi:cellobiose-specific phosphotransferase system component IIB
MTLESNPTTPRKELGGKSYYDITGGKFDFKKYVEYTSGEILKGYQLRYIYFIDKTYKEKLNVPIIPFEKIDELNAGMYKGEKITQKERHVDK